MADQPTPGLGELINIVYNPTAPRTTKAQADQYLNQLILSPDGWKSFAQHLFATTSLEAVFFCFSVLREVVMHRWLGLSERDRVELKQVLITYTQQYVGPDTPQAFRNKLAQVFGCLFRSDYPEGWPNFFTDLQAALLAQNPTTNDLNPGHVAIFIDIIKAIDAEVVSTEISRSMQEFAFANSIKDAMRVQAIPLIVQLWYNLLVKYRESNPALVVHILSSIKPFIHWIDIRLVVNETFLPLLLQLATRGEYLSGVTDCFIECIHKGMDAAPKLALMQQLQVKSFLASVNTADQPTLLKVAGLVNAIGIELIQCAIKLTDPTAAAAVQDLLQSCLLQMLNYLNHDNTIISKAVSEFCRNYLYELKKAKRANQGQPIPADQAEQMRILVQIVQKKMKFDPRNNYQELHDDETYFKEYREYLDVIFQGVTFLCPEMVVQIIAQRISQIDQIADPLDKEVCIHMFYLISEGMPDATAPSTASFFAEAIDRLTNSNIFAYRDSEILLSAYFDALKHYALYLKDRADLLPKVLRLWMEDIGVLHPDNKIRLLRSTAFIRFVKALRSNLHPFLMDVVSHLRTLLTFPPPNVQDAQSSLIFDQRAELLEAIGLLVGTGNNYEVQTQLLTALVTPLLENISTIIQQQLYKQDTPTNPVYTKWLCNLIHAAGCFSKGFPPGHSNPTPIHDYWNQAMLLVISVLNTLPNVDEVRAKALFFIHRMVSLLGHARIVPLLPQIIQLLLPPTSKVVAQTNDVIRLMIQVIVAAKENVFTVVDSHFMTIMNRIWQHLATSASVTAKSEEERELGELKRSFYSFIQALATNGLINVLVTQNNMASLGQLLPTITQGLQNLSDGLVQRACFNIVKAMIFAWGAPANTLPGFMEFVYQQLLRSLFMIPLHPKFSLEDLDCIAALREIMIIMKELYARRGQELHQLLQDTFFPSFSLPGPDTTNAFVICMQQTPKEDKAFFKEFISRAINR